MKRFKAKNEANDKDKVTSQKDNAGVRSYTLCLASDYKLVLSHVSAIGERAKDDVDGATTSMDTTLHAVRGRGW